MTVKLVLNRDLDMSFLKRNLTDENELKLVNPFAKLPFDEKFWLNSFGDSKASYSLILKEEDTEIAHAAIRQNADGKVILFFVLVAKKWQGKGFGKLLVRECEKFIDQNIRPVEYFLNVRPFNHKAIGLYKSMGFEVVERQPERIRMMKKLV